MAKMETRVFIHLLVVAVVYNSNVNGFRDIDCNFEEDMCGINKDKSARARWIRWSGDSAGGSIDHTYGNSTGFFMSVYNYGTARLLTKEYRSVFDGGPKCLTFWYSMYRTHRNGNDGVLRVYQTYNDTYLGEPIWEVNGDLGKVWRPIEMDLTSSIDFKIVIEAVRPSYSSISIDDVVITDEDCPGIYAITPDISCDFEDNLCGYQSDPTVDVDWIRQQADDGLSGDGPDEDHTFGFDYGHYLCVNPNTMPRLPGHRARIKSPIQNSTADEQEYCVLFWYYVTGGNVGKLKAFVEQNNKKKLMWNVRDEQGAWWHRSNFQVTNTEDPFQLVFEAIRGRDATEGAFCIDDVTVINGTCPIQLTTPTPTDPAPTERTWPVVGIDEAGCTFEEDCGYDAYDELGTAWQVIAARTLMAPKHDHSIGAYGHYLVVRPTLGQQWRGSKLRLRTPYIYSSSATNCLKFYYVCTSHSYCTTTRLNIYTITQSDGEVIPTDPVWSAEKTMIQLWREVKIDLPRTDDNFTVVFEAVTGYYDARYVIDDITFYDQQCSAVKPEPFKSTVDCDFEGDGMCGYTQSVTDHLDWIRFNGSTPSDGTGPDNDHTFNTTDGHYIYVEASQPAQVGQIAYIDTPYFRATNGPMCLKFWYHMKGDETGELRVRCKYQFSDTLVWRHSSSRPGWDQGIINLSSQIVNGYLTQFEFQVTIGNGYRGDIAIDDIKLLPSACNIPIPAVTHSYCSFKSGPTACNYEDYIPNYNYKAWKYLDASKPIGGGNMAVSVSKGQNSFLYVDILHSSKIYSISTPKLKPANRYCLKLSYIIKQDFGFDILYDYTSTRPFMTSLKRQMAPSWTQYSTEFESLDPEKELSIMFQARLGNAMNGFVALDDVMFTQGHCPEPEVVKKIDCDFERDCGFSTYLSSSNPWQLSNKDIHKTAKLPSIDNTYGTPSGHYYFISFRADQPLTERNFLRTPVIEKTSKKRCLQFYYYLNSNSVSSLNVYVDDEYIQRFQSDPIWTAIGKHGNRWTRAQVDIEQTKGNYSIVFEPTSGGGKYVDIAIDDVILLHNKCIKVSEPKWTSTIDCDFEGETICGYKHVRSRNLKFDWTRHGGSTQTKSTGPNQDHTYILSKEKEGKYMYIETSPPRVPFDAAELSSRLLPPSTDSKCLHFWYHMKGTAVGSLEVYRITPALSERKLLWSKTGEQGDTWKKAIVPLNVKRYFRDGSNEILDHSMKVHFKGIVGYGYNGDIAIDDVKVVLMSCDEASESLAVNEVICDFENGMERCGFEDNTNDEGSGYGAGDLLDWRFFNASSTDENRDEISSDTDIAKGENSFLYVERLHSYKTYSISTPRFKPAERFCLQLSYIIKDDFGFNILYDYSTSHTVMTSFTRPMAPSWTRYSTEFEPPRPGQEFSIMFQTRLGYAINGFVALDDVMITQGHCPEPEVVENVDCDFERDCGFSTNISSSNPWQLSKKKVHNTAKLPNIDSTYGTPSGHYYFISFRADQSLTERNFLRTPVIEKTSNKRCLQFYYYLNSNSVSSLNVYVGDKSVQRFQSDPIWTAIGKHGNRWTRAQVDIEQTKGNDSIIFEPRSGGGLYGDIAIDDVILLDSTCNKVTEPKWTSTIDCDFESETICGYKHVRNQNSKFDWTRHGGSTTTKNTGPIQDHTYILSQEKEGTYMYIETSTPRVPFDAAELSSPLLPPSTDSKCLHFWYHMSGTTVGSMEVYRITPALSETKLLWSKTGEQGDTWKKAIVPLNVKRYFMDGSKEILDHSMKVHFKGIVGYGYEGDIAIDDVKVVIMSCDPPPERLPANETRCDFENGIEECGFEDNTNDDRSGDVKLVDWSFFNASSINENRDAISNYTNIILAKNQSSYIFAKAADLEIGQRVVVSSPYIAAGSHHCLHFVYANTGDFIMDIYTMSSSGKVEVIKALPRKHQSTWRTTTVNVPHQSEAFTVMFEGVVSRVKTGLMALDDIIMENGKCQKEDSPKTLVKKTTDQPGAAESSIPVITTLAIFLALTLVLLVLLAVVYHRRVKSRSVVLADDKDELKVIETVDQAQ